MTDFQTINVTAGLRLLTTIIILLFQNTIMKRSAPYTHDATQTGRGGYTYIAHDRHGKYETARSEIVQHISHGGDKGWRRAKQTAPAARAGEDPLHDVGLFEIAEGDHTRNAQLWCLLFG